MNQTATEKPEECAFKLYKITLKDVSFETPNSPKIHTMPWDPKISLEVSADSTELRKNTYEVVLSLTITARTAGKTAYLVEVNQAAIFGLRGYEPVALNYMLNSYCPTILFPFARETAVSMVQKGGFEQLTIMPIDFDALHLKKVEEARKAEKEEQERIAEGEEAVKDGQDKSSEGEEAVKDDQEKSPEDSEKQPL